MTMEANIRARLAGTSGVYTLVGGQAAPRIFPETRAQDSLLPAIVFSTNNEESMMSLGGERARKADLEVVAVSTTKASAIAIADAVIDCLDGYSGISGGTTVHHSLHSRSVTAYQAPEGGETTGVFLHTTVFSVMYE